MNKTGRNEPCPCGSGKKLKKCCGGTLATQTPRIYPAHRFQFQLHSNFEEHIWTFGSIKVVRGSKTDSLLSDAALTEELVIGTLQDVHKAATETFWTPTNSPNIYFDYDADLVEQHTSLNPFYDSFDKRLKPPGEPECSGFVQSIQPIQISSLLTVGEIAVLYPKAIKYYLSTGNKMKVLHVLCHEFAHAFGVLHRGKQRFDQLCEPYFDCLADYFSLVANMNYGGLPETANTYRHLQYLSHELQARYQRHPSSNEEFREVAKSFLSEVGVLPCPVALLG